MAACLIGIGLLSACENYPDPAPLAPSVQTGQVENLYRKGATLWGAYQDNPVTDGPAKECGILLSIVHSMAEPTMLASAVLSENYSVQVRDLEPGREYFYQAYVSSGTSIATGEVKSFTTPSTTAPIFTELKMIETEHGRPVLSVGLEDDGGQEISMSGFCWKLLDEGDATDPTNTDEVNSVSIEQMNRFVFSGLRSNSLYAIRAYAVNGAVGYSNTLRIMTDEQGEVVLNGEIDPWAEPEEIEAIVPPAILDSIESYMPIYRGSNPPTIEGSYLIEPYEAVYCQDYDGQHGFAPGYIFISEIIRFSNQNNETLTLDYEDKDVNGLSYSIGKGSFISGEGDNFTVYFETEGELYDIYTRASQIYSGTISESGILDLYHVLIMVEKGDDPNGAVMQAGYFRLFKDGDGLAARYDWDSLVTRSVTDLPCAEMNSNYWNNLKFAK